MNDVVEYCNKYYAEDFTLADFEDHFLTKFGVNVTQDSKNPELYLFKYDQLVAKWTFPLTFFCRGIILAHVDKKWKIVSWPFNKFFNIGEHNCALDLPYYSAHPGEFSLVGKEDGSCIQMYLYLGEWRVSTLGTITTMNFNGSQATFEDLWWQTVKQATGRTKDEFCRPLRSGHTHIFELCTPFNRIVSRYNTSTIFLLGLRDFVSTRLFTQGELDDFAIELGVKRPKTISCWDLSTVAELEAFAERDADVRLEGEPEYKEGFVLYDNSKPIAKIKNNKYRALHGLIGGQDPTFMTKNLVRCFFDGKIDDIYAALDDNLKTGIEALKVAVTKYAASVGSLQRELLTEFAKVVTDDPKEKQKQYALLVQKMVKTFSDAFEQNTCKSYLFTAREELLVGRTSEFTTFLSFNAEKHVDHWKKVVFAAAFPSAK